MPKRKGQRNIDREIKKLNQKVYNLRSSYKRYGLKVPKVETIKGYNQQSYKELRKQANKLNTAIKRAVNTRTQYVKSTRAVKGVRVSKEIANEYLAQNEIVNNQREQLGRVAFEVARDTKEISEYMTYQQFYEQFASDRGFMKDNLESTVTIRGQQKIDDYFRRNIRRLTVGQDERREKARDNLLASIDNIEAQGMDKRGMEIYRKIVNEMSDDDFDIFIASFQAVTDTFRYNDIHFTEKPKEIWELLKKVTNYGNFYEYFTDEDRSYIDELYKDNINKYEEGKMVPAKEGMQKQMTSNKK